VPDGVRNAISVLDQGVRGILRKREVFSGTYKILTEFVYFGGKSGMITVTGGDVKNVTR
jgi:hypothetical protein